MRRGGNLSASAVIGTSAAATKKSAARSDEPHRLMPFLYPAMTSNPSRRNGQTVNNDCPAASHAASTPNKKHVVIPNAYLRDWNHDAAISTSAIGHAASFTSVRKPSVI